MVVAGKFKSFTGVEPGTIVRLAADGRVDASFVPPTFEDVAPLAVQSEVYALVQQGDKLLAGGNFKVKNGAVTYTKLLRQLAV